MPIYEYQCPACGHRLEAIQRVSDAPLQECPTCGEDRLKKLISAVGFRLSGKGWYETDFKKDRQRNLSQKESAEDKKAAKSKEAGDQGKPAASGASKDSNKTNELTPAKPATPSSAAGG